MFTVEVRVNGTLIVHVYGRNVSGAPSGRPNEYHYDLVELSQDSRSAIDGRVSHVPDKGITELVRLILADVNRQKAQRGMAFGRNC